MGRSAVRRAIGVAALSGGLALSAGFAATAAAQCAMCGTALTNSAEGRAMTPAFNRAILVMLAAPYGLMATAAVYLGRHRLRALAVRLRPAALPRRDRG
ncbi:MAG: hypothetical protein ABW221_13435 [Vicinamibacteria bacterium]